jgi:hypothetical protein
VNAGFDKIHLWTQEKPSDILLKNDFTFHSNKQGLWKSTHLKNMRIHITEAGIFIKGSLPRYYHGTNCIDLTRSETKEAITRLSEDLGLHIAEAKVTSLEFGVNIVVDHLPEEYYQYLGPCNLLERFTKPHSLYYENSYRQFIFYNKKLEAKNEAPEVWNGLNVMRVETRKKKSVSKQLKRSIIEGATLSEPNFFRSMQDKFLLDYHSIYKITIPKVNMKKVKTPKDFYDLMFAIGVDSIGGPNVAIDFLKNHFESKGFTRREYFSRLKKKTKEICSSTTIEESFLIEELTEKISNAI